MNVPAYCKTALRRKLLKPLLLALCKPNGNLHGKGIFLVRAQTSGRSSGAFSSSASRHGYPQILEIITTTIPMMMPRKTDSNVIFKNAFNLIDISAP